jgi:hypothetical protein
MIKSELGLVDKMIYEIYKDKVVNGSCYFKRKVKSDYGYIPSSDLYRKIINYQVKKYGKQLTTEFVRKYDRLFYKKTPIGRKNAAYRSYKNQRAKKILERLENGER